MRDLLNAHSRPGTILRRRRAKLTPLSVKEAVDFHLNATGLFAHVEWGSMAWQGWRGGYLLNLRESAVEFLEANGLFREGRLGSFHQRDVGAPWRDFRSLTGGLFPRSLQVTFNARTLFAWVDTDKYNPYQGVKGALGHTFAEVVPFIVRRGLRAGAGRGAGREVFLPGKQMDAC